MKYYLLIHGEVTNENTLMCFDTPAERDEETILRIFGEDITTQDEARRRRLGCERQPTEMQLARMELLDQQLEGQVL